MANSQCHSVRSLKIQGPRDQTSGKLLNPQQCAGTVTAFEMEAMIFVNTVSAEREWVETEKLHGTVLEPYL